MGFRIWKVYEFVILLNVLSSCILFALVSTQVVSSIDYSTNNTIQSDIDRTLHSEGDENFREETIPNPYLSDKASDKKEETLISDVIGSQEFIFTEVLSQNSAVVNGGLAETAHPVLVTLVDTAAAELTNTLVGQLELDKGNFTDTEPDYNSTPVTSELPSELYNSTDEVLQARIVTESQDNLKPQYVVKVVPKQKDDEKTIEKLKDITNVTDDSVVSVKSDNSTSEQEPVKKIDDAPKSNEVQEEIPSFAEWAQKQLEEAEKNKESGVNDSSQTTLGTVSTNANTKVRSKNYASPDCGAKIVAANPESGSSSFVLSPSRDEYMLNTCNSRIWFVVELCEAIQAKKVDLANFELFSSTPKNFSVYVSDRFPTRDWASVGQFIAKDERDIQTFNLHPHLFGKFIKFELHSYYGSEHYCPISLFRVYGTSEFEVFETENSPHSQSNLAADDEDDDDILEDVPDKENQELSRNLFGSARDAVMSIMKKAAQVLVKGSDSKNSSDNIHTIPINNKKCKTPSHIIVCDNCSNTMFTDVYDLMSCENNVLNNLIEAPLIHNTLCNTEICQQYGLDFKSKRTSSLKTEIASYISALLMPSYVAALCNMLAIVEKKVVLNTSYETDLNVTTNLTIDKKVQKVAESGMINELLLGPFSQCAENADHPSCQNKVKENLKPDIVASITSSVPSDLENGIVTDIKPTKTLQNDIDPLEPSILTAKPGSENTVTNTHQNDRQYVERQDIEASMVNTVEPKETETLTKDESDKIPVIDSDSTVDTKLEDTPEFSSIITPHEINNDIDNMEGVEDGHIKLSTQDQISLDKLLSELERVHTDPATPSPHNNAAPAFTHQGQKESVFLRLSNRIKALERNMSLSGQYLEELSRRYKKQMEEMQRTFEKTLVAMSEESKKAEEREHKSAEEMIFLQQQMVQLSTSVNLLLADRDSFLGSVSMFKVLMFQILITILVMYFLKRYNANKKGETEKKTSSPQKNTRQDNPITRRKSTEEISVTSLTGEPKVPKKRRPSEEALTITRNTEMRDSSNLLKNEKKKRKRKSPIFQRSYSIASASRTLLADGQNRVPKKEEDIWSGRDMNVATLEIPFVLEEADFISPELDPVDFSRMGEIKVPNNLNGITPKKEFPKTNGSIFGKKTPDREHSEKVRRLSSPAFFRAALNRQSSKSITSDISTREESPIGKMTPRKLEIANREVKSEERRIRAGTESPQLSMWSSIGDVSEASTSTQPEPVGKKKRSKGRSFKNIFKKVF